ncbi:MAG: hypothetical protein LBH27_00540 [Endomicrobium sp.]|jgi:dolichol kinase|nr:hypothetical protein [Endomicrobium sp.]
MACIPKDEINRKMFHLLSLIYIYSYWYIPKIIVIYGLLITIIVVIFFEYFRFKNYKFKIFFENNFKSFCRPEETKKISGLIGTLLGALFTILIFNNKRMVFASFLYFAFGDLIAAIIGKGFGKNKFFSKKKTVEGSLSCLTVCFIIGIFIFNDWKFALFGAIVATFIEAIPWKINDNFWMQIINAWFLSFLSTIM